MFKNLFNFKGSPKISEKILEQYGITIVNFNDIKLDKTPIANTGSGTFYKGTYKKVPCSVKVIDITKSDAVKKEFVLWNEYKDNENFLNLLGACIKGDDAYLVFEFFAFTIEFALKQNLITEDNRSDLVKQCLYIISVLQNDERKTSDIRPGVFGITDQVVVKLLDFGTSVSDPLFNNDKIVDERMKYQPPEYFRYKGEDLNYDLWSTGCFLIDIYSTEEPIYTKKMTQNELIKGIFEEENYPSIPSDLSPLLKSILGRCFEKDIDKRLKIDELVDNMRIFFDIDNYENLNHHEVHNFSFDYENKLEKCYQFAKEINNSMSFTSMMINTNYFVDIENMISAIESYKNECLSNLDKNLQRITNSIQILYEINKKIINNFHEKALSKLLIMKQYFNFALIEITRTKKISDEVKRGINALPKWKNLENHTNIIETYENSIEQIKEIVQQFSVNSAFDKISTTYNSNCDIIDSFQGIMKNKSLSLQTFIDFFFENSYMFLSANDINWFCNQLGITDEIVEEYTIKPPAEENNINNINEENYENNNNNINNNA